MELCISSNYCRQFLDASRLFEPPHRYQTNLCRLCIFLRYNIEVFMIVTAYNTEFIYLFFMVHCIFISSRLQGTYQGTCMYICGCIICLYVSYFFWHNTISTDNFFRPSLFPCPSVSLLRLV